VSGKSEAVTRVTSSREHALSTVSSKVTVLSLDKARLSNAAVTSIVKVPTSAAFVLTMVNVFVVVSKVIAAGRVACPCSFAE